MKRILDTSHPFSSAGNDAALHYCAQLLSDLEENITLSTGDLTALIDTQLSHHARDKNRWQESGLKELTGSASSPLEICPVPIAEFADGILHALQVLSATLLSKRYRGADLVTKRSTFTGKLRQGNVSVGGSCRLINCVDGTIAINLARDDDWSLINAWLLSEVTPNWESITRHIQNLPKAQLIKQGRLLGMAITDANPSLPKNREWYRITHHGRAQQNQTGAPRVIDLSSLWAGPLCTKLLKDCGAEVIKVESTARPDGARLGSPDFFNFLNKGKSTISLNLDEQSGRDSLLQLIKSADIVLEASRPRALRQLGIIAEDLVDQTPGLTWVSITGYGREEPQANWIAYGDDAGVAGGLSAEIYKVTGEWMFCGDAIADPITGMHAALAAYASWVSGGGHLLSLPLYRSIQNCVLTEQKLKHNIKDH